MGFSEVMPALITREADSQLEWVLSGFDVTPDSEREEDAASLLSELPQLYGRGAVSG
ncbi:hypothetical protein O0544_16735 [Edwardsiella anguillarum]|nr:hypothetical protein [Edwardsiella anguillarum]